MKKPMPLAALLLLTCVATQMVANQSYAHTIWASDGLLQPRPGETGASCGAEAGHRATLEPGSYIDVSYSVRISHGNEVTIAFSTTGSPPFETLKSGLPQTKGTHNTNIQLPNIECEQCVLRVDGSSYQSCADIRLSHSLTSSENDFQAPNPVNELSANTTDHSIHLSWLNPSSDHFGTLLVLSKSTFEGGPTDGVDYAPKMTLANGIVLHKEEGTTLTTDYWASALEPDTLYVVSLFAYDEHYNYSTATEISAMTTGIGNTAPTIALSAMQNGEINSQVVINGGLVEVQALVMDEDTEDSHTYNWSATDADLIDNDDSESTLTFDPSHLSPGVYNIRLTVSDNGVPPRTSNSTLPITVAQNTNQQIPTGNTASGNTSSGGTLSYLLFSLAALLFGKGTISIRSTKPNSGRGAKAPKP